MRRRVAMGNNSILPARTLCVIFLTGMMTGSVIVRADDPDKPKSRQSNAIQKRGGSPQYGVLNISNLSAWFRADGLSNRSPITREGARFPRFTAQAIYQDGFLWGGRVYRDAALTQSGPFGQTVRVGGTNYVTGTIAGRIIGTGASALPQDPNGADVRMFRIRRDYKEMSDNEIRRDAANVNEIPIQEVMQAQMQAVRDQYDKDWKEWPVALGAPFIDRNRNGRYDPPPFFNHAFTADSLITGGYDEPGIAGVDPGSPADQVLWHVFNDLDREQTLAFLLSEPIGLELQKTVWAYKRSDAFGDAYFTRLRIINKGGVDIDGNGTRGTFYLDSMYVAQWVDPDLGNSIDDLVGVDTLLGLGYVYNEFPGDIEYRRFNLPAPAVGYDMLSGPLVSSSSDSALFDVRWKRGFKNLSPLGFTYASPGSSLDDPPRTYPNVTLRWYKALRGFVPTGGPDSYFPFPPGMPAGPFPLSGDPLTGSGFVDGMGTNYSFPPGDRRFTLSTGPFQMAPGDTQEVVVATLGGLGADRLSSISVLRSNSRLIQTTYENRFRFLVPKTRIEIRHPDEARSTVIVRCEVLGTLPAEMKAVFRRQNGTSPGTIQLFDDGLHDDGVASDGIFGNSLTVEREEAPLALDLHITDLYGHTTLLNRHRERITVAGPLIINSLTVGSDNLNNDGAVNPGEDIRFGFTLRNSTTYNLKVVRLSQVQPLNHAEKIVPEIKPGASATLAYDPTDPNSFFRFAVPYTHKEKTYSVHLRAMDALGNEWTLVLNFPVRQLRTPVILQQLPKTEGFVDGSFEIRIVDPALLRDHLYVLRGIDSVNTHRDPGFTLVDSTDGRVLINTAPIPDSTGHNVLITDGFKILRGTIPAPGIGGMKDWSVPNGTRRFAFADGYAFFEGFEKTIGWNEPAYFFGTKTERTVRAHELKNVLLRLAAAGSASSTNPNAGNNPYGGWDENNPGNDPNFSYAYRYLRNATAAPARPEFAPYIVNPTAGYAYQDYKQGVPLSAWDVEANPPARLTVGHLENNTATGLVDGKWWPGANGTGSGGNSTNTREWLFILNAPYTGSTPVSAFQKDILNNALPVMWWLGVNRLDGNNFFAGDEFLIHAIHPLTSKDIWIFKPSLFVPGNVGGYKGQPESFALHQNYPNPFNQGTVVEFSLPTTCVVRLEIIDLLGRTVEVLTVGQLTGGTYKQHWTPAGLATGVYFYRLDVHRLDRNRGGVWSQTKKLLLVK